MDLGTLGDLHLTVDFKTLGSFAYRAVDWLLFQCDVTSRFGIRGNPHFFPLKMNVLIEIPFDVFQ